MGCSEELFVASLIIFEKNNYSPHRHNRGLGIAECAGFERLFSVIVPGSEEEMCSEREGKDEELRLNEEYVFFT